MDEYKILLICLDSLGVFRNGMERDGTGGNGLEWRGVDIISTMGVGLFDLSIIYMYMHSSTFWRCSGGVVVMVVVVVVWDTM
jgi:hypothetical protein